MYDWKNTIETYFNFDRLYIVSYEIIRKNIIQANENQLYHFNLVGICYMLMLPLLLVITLLTRLGLSADSFSPQVEDGYVTGSAGLAFRHRSMRNISQTYSLQIASI